MSEAVPLFEFDAPAFTGDLGGVSVRQINYETARTIIENHHYLGAAGSTVYAFGMYHDGVLAGAITYGTIPGPNARGICGAEHQGKVLELTRLFIHDWLGANAESKFIGATFAALRPRAIAQHGMILLSYADTGAGHRGIIYQATNWLYTGTSTASKVVLPNGEVVHSRVASDARRGMSSAGLERVDGSAKHRYVYFLGSKTHRKMLRRSLRWPVLPYPKDQPG